MNQPPTRNKPKVAPNRPANGGPIRTCVACARAFAVHKSKPRTHATFSAQSNDGRLRVLRVCAQRKSENPQVLVDLDGRGLGRGAWICATSTCIERAWQRKSFVRALKGAAPGDELKQHLLRACVE